MKVNASLNQYEREIDLKKSSAAEPPLGGKLPLFKGNQPVENFNLLK